jgi:putative Mg2+ transporter-C (MgtC) family protein
MFESDFSIFIRIVVIVVLAGFLGWERETAGKAAGLRTHILVGVGAVLFVVLGETFVEKFRHHTELMRFDPIRIVEAIVTGISFLGAGIIFVSRDQNRVRGLTTAASIGSTVIIFSVLRFLVYLDIKIKDKNSEDTAES